MSHLANILGSQNNITSEIQRLGAHASGALANVAAKAAYPNITSFVLECYAVADSLRFIAKCLNEVGHRTQHGAASASPVCAAFWCAPVYPNHTPAFSFFDRSMKLRPLSASAWRTYDGPASIVPNSPFRSKATF